MFASLLKRRLLLEKQMLLKEEKILSFKCKSNFGRAMLANEANRKSRNLFTIVKMGALR